MRRSVGVILLFLRYCISNSVAVEHDTAPTGMIGRGHYEASSKFCDDDGHTYLQFKWAFDIKKDW